MVNHCVCNGCHNSCLTGQRVYRFPNRQKRVACFEAWVRFVRAGRADFCAASVTKHSVICEAHFGPEDMRAGDMLELEMGFRNQGQVRLKEDAVPSLQMGDEGAEPNLAHKEHCFNPTLNGAASHPEPADVLDKPPAEPRTEPPCPSPSAAASHAAGRSSPSRPNVQALKTEVVGGNVQSPRVSSGLCLKQEVPETPRIKEEPEERSIKQEEEPLPVSFPQFIAVTVNTEEKSSQCGQTRAKEEEQGEDVDHHSSDTDNDDYWDGLSLSGAKSTGLFPKYKCPETSTNDNNKDVSGTAGKKHQCLLCQKLFKRKWDLGLHMTVHTSNNPFSCTTCNIFFTQQPHLDLHMRTHTGEQPHTCPFCEKSFIRNSNLMKHISIHTGQTPYSCSVCDQRFAQREHLDCHREEHAGENPFSCLICNKSFIKKGNLVKHRRIHTGETPYSCSTCGKTFLEKGHLESHRKSHTEKRYSCTVCFSAFSRKSFLRSHMSLHRRQSVSAASGETWRP